jgi:hypothetical protein
MIILGAALLVVLIFLAKVRTSIPVHIEAELTHLRVKLAQSTPALEWSLLRNVPVNSLTFTDCQGIRLAGRFYDLNTSRPIEGIGELSLVPDGAMASITFDGVLQLEDLIVGPEARVEITRSIGFQITESSSCVEISMDDSVEVAWEACSATAPEGMLPQRFAGGTGRLGFRPNIASRHLTFAGAHELLNVYVELPTDWICLLEEELPVAELNFVQQRFGDLRPDVTTTIKAARITFPTLPDSKPVSLPEGSYLKIDNLHDFTLKRVRIDPSATHIEATLYGYTNDLQAAYGRGKLTQVLPASLLLLWQNVLLVIVVIVMLWFVKTGFDLYDRWRGWKGEKG